MCKSAALNSFDEVARVAVAVPMPSFIALCVFVAGSEWLLRQQTEQREGEVVFAFLQPNIREL